MVAVKSSSVAEDEPENYDDVSYSEREKSK